ncbi:MAG: hypothetical protein ABL889_08105 [Terricaulis sp.]
MSKLTGPLVGLLLIAVTTVGGGLLWTRGHDVAPSPGRPPTPYAAAEAARLGLTNCSTTADGGLADCTPTDGAINGPDDIPAAPDDLDHQPTQASHADRQSMVLQMLADRLVHCADGYHFGLRIWDASNNAAVRAAIAENRARGITRTQIPARIQVFDRISLHIEDIPISDAGRANGTEDAFLVYGHCHIVRTGDGPWSDCQNARTPGFTQRTNEGLEMPEFKVERLNGQWHFLDIQEQPLPEPIPEVATSCPNGAAPQPLDRSIFAAR